MNVMQDLIPAGRKNRPGNSMAPKYITIHDTGNTRAGADAVMHAKYLKTLNEGWPSWHFTVDDKNIVQHLPLNENGWHAGDNQGPGNRQSIGIEICENTDGNRAAAEKKAAELCAHLVKTVPSLLSFPGCMKQHWDWSKKNCPRIIRGRPGGWEKFLKLVEGALKPEPLPQIKKRVPVILRGREIDTPGYLIDGLAYVPLRFLGENLGAKVGWREDKAYVD